MKKVVIILMLAVCLVAGCKGKKQVYTEADVKVKDVLAPGTDVDWIALYLRAHELDSVKNVAEMNAVKVGQPMETLPDSIPLIWDAMLKEVLLRHGEEAFDNLFENHRSDIARYLRLDFINYGFITKVYLPYKATVNTQEDYGEICIRELESEMEKAQMSMMLSHQVPSHYEHLLKDLFFAYVNYGKNDKALNLCEEVLQYLGANYGEDSMEYANTLNNKANICHNMGNNYSAMIAAKQAIEIYNHILTSTGKDDDHDADHEDHEEHDEHHHEEDHDSNAIVQIIEERDKLLEKLKLWQGQ